MFDENITPIFKFLLDDGLDETFLPTKAEPNATGWDVRAAEEVWFTPTKPVKIPLGVRCFAPDGWWLELRPRSSTFGKKNIHALYGVIDCSYEGELIFSCQWIPVLDSFISKIIQGQDWSELFSHLFKIEKGERIGQLIPVRRQEMKVESITKEQFESLCKERGANRGSGGYGSTGDK